MSNFVWEEYKKFCKSCGKAMSKSMNRFGLITRTVTFMGNFFYWLFGSAFYMVPLFVIWGFQFCWWGAKLFCGLLIDLVFVLFPKLAPADNLSRKARGEAYEKYVADRLRGEGFDNIRMTRSSGDFGVDILAEKDGVKYAIQCKRYSKPVGVKAVQEVYSGCHKYGMEQPVVVASSSFTPNARTLAHDLGVSLWDLETFDAIF